MTYLQTPTPSTASTKGGHLFVFLVELLQIGRLGRGHLLAAVNSNTATCSVRCLVLAKVLADVPAVQVADSRPHVFKVGERTCGQTLCE